MEPYTAALFDVPPATLRFIAAARSVAMLRFVGGCRPRTRGDGDGVWLLWRAITRMEL